MTRYVELDSGFLIHETIALELFGFLPERGDLVVFDGHDYRAVGRCIGDLIEFEAV